MSSPTKKRKRDADTTEKVSFQVSAEPAQQLGPVLASFPTFKPAPSTPFRCYLTKKELAKEEPEREFASRATVIAGEAETVEFSTADETEQASAAGCRYLVGVYNRRTGTVTVRPAPLHILAHAVKPLKSIQPNGVSLLARLEARAALGESFGTKKAKAAIRAAERNKVDVSAMEDVVEHLQETIVEGTGGLPTLEEAKEAADSNRLIPPHNADTDDPADVYPLHNIIPEIEWKTISVSAFLKTRSDKDRKALLPYQGSLWVMQHLKQECEADSPNKKRLCVPYLW
jgi:DNA-directed RNA polymerase I subunit RPA49